MSIAMKESSEELYKLPYSDPTVTRFEILVVYVILTMSFLEQKVTDGK